MASFRVCFPRSSPAEMAWFLENCSAGIRILRLQQKMVGFSLINSTHGPDVAWLEMIAVLPEYQGRGLGKWVLEDYERFAKQLGYPRLELAVDAENQPAVSLYKNTGYNLQRCKNGRIIFSKRLQLDREAGPGVCQPRLPKRIWLALLRRLLVRV